MNTDDILDLFEATARAVADAVERLDGTERRAKTGKPGQYALDVAADNAALAVLHKAPVQVMSEELRRQEGPPATGRPLRTSTRTIG